DGLDPEPLSYPLGELQNIVSRKDIAIGVVPRRGPFAVLRRHFGRGKQTALGITRERFSQEAVALTVAVRPGRVEEIAAQINRELQSGERLHIVGAGPVAHAPQAMANVAHVESRAPESAVVHGNAFRFPLSAARL